MLRRGVFNTRPRDFYRDQSNKYRIFLAIAKNIEESPELCFMWEKYYKQFTYAENVKYDDILSEMNELIY